MGIEGIGARVARKEDKRFITGAGRYVDDMVVPGMKHAVFVRSPHAHAEITGIDVSAAKAMPGVIGVLAGKELKADGIGNLICGCPGSIAFEASVTAGSSLYDTSTASAASRACPLVSATTTATASPT